MLSFCEKGTRHLPAEDDIENSVLYSWALL